MERIKYFSLALYIILLFSLIVISKPLFEIIVFNKNKDLNQFYFYFLFFFVFITIPSIIGIIYKKRGNDFLLLLCINILSIYLFEIFLEIRNVRSNDLTYKAIKEAKKLKIEFDTRTKIEFLDSLTNIGLNAFSPISPRHFFGDQKYRDGLSLFNGKKIFPLGGISNSFTTYDNSNGFYPLVLLDDYGFNNKIKFEKFKNVEVVLIGDSFTEGMSVNPDHTISGRMNYYGINTLSFGKIGNGPLTELATLIEYGIKIKPKIVVWLYCSNDLERLNLPNELKSSILIKYLYNKDFSQNLIYRQNQIDSLLINYLEEKKENFRNKEKHLAISIKEIIRLWNFRSFLVIENNTKLNIETPLNEFELILSRAKEILDTWDGKLIFLFIPDYQEFIEPFKSHYNKEPVFEIVKKLNILTIDGKKDIFDKHNDPISLFPFGLPLHFNKNGYDLIANEIINKLDLHNEH